MPGEADLPPRFVAERLLKRGHGIDTWLATDRESGRDMVVKTAPIETLSASVLRRLELEAVRGGELRGAGAGRTLVLGEHRGVSFVAMPYVPGVSLDARLASGALGVDETIAVARDLLRTLRTLHGASAVHGDVKPGNVIVAEAGVLGGGTLIDFGLSRSVVVLQVGDAERAGTALHMAPEQAGLFGHGADARSDLYSLGLTLFECLAGHHPLRGTGPGATDVDASLGAILRAHLTVTPPSLSALVPAVPRALAEVVRRLLQKDPRDRYQTASGVLADLDEIADARAAGVPDPLVVVGRHDRRTALAEPAFVARVAELARLEVALDRLALSGGGLVQIEAESGGGKSRLMGELRQRCIARGQWVLQTRGVEQSAEVPFRSFHDIAERVLELAVHDADFAASVKAQLSPFGPSLVAALPELRRLLDDTSAAGQEAHLDVRTIQALAALLGALGSAKQPAVVLVDDAQWVPQQTQRAFGEWLGSTADAPRRVLVVMAFRTEEVAVDHPLRLLPTLDAMRLPPLSGGEMRRLAESMTGALPAEVSEVVARLSEGNPFLGTSVVQGLIETGALVASDAGWVIEPQALGAVQASRRAATLLARRLQQLVPATRAVLAAGAVLGRTFDIQRAAALAGFAIDAANQALADARDRQIVWLDADGAGCTFVHDRLRETMLDALTAEERRALHHQAALVVRALPTPSVFEIAYHHDAADEAAQALPFALAAAELARAGSDFETATRYFRIAERGVGADVAARGRIAEALGDLALVAGRYEEAESYLESAAGAAQGRLEQAQLQAKLGYLGHRRGNWNQSIGAFEKALRLTGQHVPRTRLGFLLAFLWALFVQLGHSLVPRRMLGRRPVSAGAADLLAVDIYCRLTHHYILGRGPVPALAAHLRSLNLAERYPPTWQLAYATVNHGLILSTLPWLRRAYAYADRAAAMQRQLGDPWHLGMVLQLQAVVYQWTAQIDKALLINAEAAALLRRVGDRWEAEVCDCLAAACLYRRGRLREAIEIARKVVYSSRVSGSDTALVHALGYWSKASAGEVAESLVHEAETRAGSQPHIAETALQADGVRLLGLGRPREAELVFARAAAIVRRMKLRSDLVAPIPCWLATCLRMQAASAEGPERARLAKQAARMARRAVRLAHSFHNNLPHALREVGLILALRGNLARGRKWLDASLRHAEALGAAHEVCMTTLARAELDQALGATGAGAAAEQARAALRALREGAAPPVMVAAQPHEARSLSLAERFEFLLESGRGLISTFDAEVVYARALDSARRLLRADECAIGVVGPDGTPRILAGDQGIVLSRGVVAEALRLGRVAALNDASDPTRTAGMIESVILSEARSALCAPIHVRGETRHFLYVASRQVWGLLGEDDLRVAQFVATLAGAALENAEGFRQVEAAEIEIRKLSSAVGRAQEEERRRLAYALHDGAGQTLASVVIQLVMLSRGLDKSDDRTAIGEVMSQLDELIGELRDLTHDLRPAALDRLGLASALRELAERSTSDEFEVTVTIAPRVPSSVPYELALNIFRLVQAALVNVIRHAGAQRATIRLQADQGHLRVEVADDGVGFDAAVAPPDGGIGILGMRERAGWLGGRFEIRSAPGQGTVVALDVPLVEA